MERRMRRRDAKLDELADEADVPHLRLQVVLALLALEPAELRQELRDEERADVLERLGYDGGDPSVLGDELEGRPRHGEEGPHEALPRALGRVALAEGQGEGVGALPVEDRGEVLGQQAADDVPRLRGGVLAATV